MPIDAISFAAPSFPALSTSTNSASTTIEQAARQFESILIAQMLRSARESGAASPDDEEGESESSTMLDLSEQQFANILAQKGGLNLSRLIVEGLKAGELRTNSGKFNATER